MTNYKGGHFDHKSQVQLLRSFDPLKLQQEQNFLMVLAPSQKEK